MPIQITFEKTDLESLAYLRHQYIDELPYSQEYFLEEKVARGEPSLIYIDKSRAGYYIEGEAGTLLEFFLSSHFRADAEEIFLAVLEHTRVKQVFCKSFDSLLLKCCLRAKLPYEPGGVLFRDYSATFATMGNAGDLKARQATLEDLDALLPFEDLAEDREELERMIRGNNLNLFYLGEELVGCGYIFHIVENKNFYDIGMWVHPEKRGQGHARAIVNFQKRYCLENDLVPVCGCAADNIASKKVLEKCGFISRHDLVTFSTPD
ncbi:MAG: GNAT family N-acetyltransferase [Candidatus Obscuribacterales bacterium]|nr:GNAT family N-acetyltransferase [Cyanobacteria bacterium HKST-UBA01]MCB9469589.1 GNAT family N-acetyltransferase [Candidatus Obscuribacterales bacterium]